MKISVIVPAYNVENYILKCLESLAAQTYPNLEVIVVNDGSTDHTKTLIDAFCAKHKNFISVDKPNGGLSSARNAGFAYATGELIGFVDSDDYADPDMYEFLYQQLTTADADLAICGKYYYKNGISTPMQKADIHLCMHGNEALKQLLIGNPFQNEAWDKLYKRELWAQIRFPEGKQYEDSAIMYRILHQCKTVVYDSAPKYHYLIRQSSITGTNFNPKRMDYLEAGKLCLEYVQQHESQLTPLAAFRYVSIGLFLARDIILCDSKAYDDYLNTIAREIKAYQSLAKQSGHLTKKQRLQLAALSLGLPIFKAVVTFGTKKRSHS